MSDFSKISIVDYYNTYVSTLSNRLKKVANKEKAMMVCPLHDDTDPSMGVMHNKDGESFHCFGCNAWGNILDLHKKVSQSYMGKYMSNEEALKDLYRVMSVAYEGSYLLEYVSEGTLENGEEVGSRIAIKQRSKQYDFSDFKADIVKGKVNGINDIRYYNTRYMRAVYSSLRSE